MKLTEIRITIATPDRDHARHILGIFMAHAGNELLRRPTAMLDIHFCPEEEIDGAKIPGRWSNLSKDERDHIIEKCDETLKLLNQLELELGHWIAKKKNEALEIRREALEGLLKEEKG